MLINFSLFLKISKELPAVVGFTLIGSILFMSIFASFLAPTDPLAQNLRERLIPPFLSEKGSSEHLLGTDHLGRDILSRIMFGARLSILIAFISVLIGVGAGVFLGLICGYYEGILDSVIMRIADVQLAFPLLLLIIAVIAALGQSLANMILVLGITSWVRFARIVRGETLSIKKREFVTAIQAIGGNDFRVLACHILPNVTASVSVMATLELARIILTESTLSFLGLGVPAEIPSLGVMLSEGRTYLATAWWLATYPGLTIMITVLGINLVGDWLRDFLDPRFYRKV